jgi:hypothetical protein
VKRLVTIGLVLFAAAGCQKTYHAHLSDGAGLTEGSPVLVSSVRVGQVESVRVVEGQVDVEVAIEREHEITVRADACAMARRTEAGPELIILPGEGAPIAEDRAIPQCEITSDDVGGLMRSLGEGMNEVLRQLGQGLFNGAQQGGSGASQPSSPLPSLPLPTLPQPSPQPSSPLPPPPPMP